MNRTKIKNYAPKARREFIQAVKDRAAYYGLTEAKTEPVVEKGDGVVICGKAFPRAVGEKRKKLEELVRQYGFDPAMERLAYTWFNRFVALRFMELHGYLEHGYRVLSHPEGKTTPELLEHAEHVDLPKHLQQQVIELKLAGNKEAELYRLLLVHQCNVLNTVLPFLFERIDDETELVLPDNLLHSDSLVRKLVAEIEEEDWRQVEIIGWIYQFYISERKDEVIGKVVASEDIPAATQLFTPNWIVKYLVQNTLGRQWLATYPQSALRPQMEYFIESAEQTAEVHEQLKAITPTSLNPEELTLLDPACGSGHILVEAYDLFKAIYQERGYRAKDIPALILTKNLFGLEIDDRAAQLAAFALMMKARADDRRIFDSDAKPNIVAIQDSKGLNAEDITHALNAFAPTVDEGHVSQGDIETLLSLFENGKSFGSLIQISPNLTAKLPEIEKRLDEVLKFGDLTHALAHVLKPIVHQARLLARKYDAVVANPPYMGGKGMYVPIKNFAKQFFPRTKADLFAVFMERSFGLLQDDGRLGMVAMQSWMFLPSFEEFRTWLLSKKTLVCLAHFGPKAFSSLSGEVVQTAASVFGNRRVFQYRPTFQRLIDGGEEEKALAIRSKAELLTTLTQEAFEVIPNVPIAYWIGEGERRAFAEGIPLKTIGMPRQGNTTTNNAQYVRSWFEVSYDKIGFGYTSMEAFDSDHKKWIPYNKGGGTLRWYGLNESVVNWENSGAEIKAIPHSVVANEKLYLRDGITWATVSSSKFGFRRFGVGFVFDNKGACLFLPEALIEYVLAVLNSDVCRSLLIDITPSVSLQPGDVGRLPIIEPKDDAIRSELIENVKQCIASAKTLWDSQEISWDFQESPVIQSRSNLNAVTAFDIASKTMNVALSTIRSLEWRNTELLQRVYGLNHKLNDHDDIGYESSWLNPFDIAINLISYALGCMMGRYSLDKPGLVYAHAGNEGFDSSQYKTFPADPDGILPLTELDWGFEDDPVKRVEEFVSVAWPKEHLAENLQFLEDGLGEPIRKYLATGFYKDHLRWYKRRPIYWLFSSGKQRAFQCLVYLHRYHEGTLARMRTEYVIPLQGRIAARIEQLENEKNNAKSASRRNQIQKEIDKLVKQQTELRSYDEVLRHAADQRIKLDLDDGVKVNYGKFGDLLAEVKAVTGGKDEE